MYTFFVLVVGILIGFYGPVYLSNLFTYLQTRQLVKDSTPQNVDESKLCKTPHSWIKAKTFTDKGIGSVDVCQVCGFIPSLDKMATPDAIDSIEESNRIDEIQGKIYRDFQTQEDNDIKKYFEEEIKNGVSFEKLAHVHAAGLTFGARFSNYRASRAEEVQKALSRSNA